LQRSSCLVLKVEIQISSRSTKSTTLNTSPAGQGELKRLIKVLDIRVTCYTVDIKNLKITTFLN